jgi:hypothetical protein
LRRPGRPIQEERPEAGIGFVIHLSLGAYAYTHGHYNAAMLALYFAAALLTLIRSDGSEITVETNASIIEYEGRPASLSYCRDNVP